MIARLRSNKGEVDAALDLHLEALKIFEELGDRLARAIALGDIAQLRADKGEFDAELDLHLEELKVHEELGDDDRTQAPSATSPASARTRAKSTLRSTCTLNGSRSLRSWGTDASAPSLSATSRTSVLF